jgi:NADPH:quinone reductase-like Zn-dependent oxidoreductase
MKAIRIATFGGPEVLQLEEIARPIPAADEVLVQVMACGVNRAEMRIRSGSINDRMPVPLPWTPGSDFAGTVAAVGADVTTFQPGEEVYGVANFPGEGSYAEYVVAKVGQVGHKPQGVSFVETAGVPLAALTAWTGLYAAGHLQAGERVLIHGASGGVGTFAVQLAKWTGAYVIATASAANQEFVKGLGADEVLDYHQPFEQQLHDLNMVFDGVGESGTELQLRSVQVLRAGGRLVSAQFIPFTTEVQQALDQQSATGESFGVHMRSETLNELAQLLAIVSKVYPLAQAAAAHHDLEGRGTQGKIVLEVQPEV